LTFYTSKSRFKYAFTLGYLIVSGSITQATECDSAESPTSCVSRLQGICSLTLGGQLP